VDLFWGIVAIVGSVGGVGLIIYLQLKGPGERLDEEDARTFFDEHGHWPDETAEEAGDRLRAAGESARRVDEATRAHAADVDVSDRPDRKR
jgi:hypothetical protein